MAKFIVTFKGPLSDRGRSPEPEEVAADSMIDHKPFVDFYVSGPSGVSQFVARYRQEDIRKIERED
jgi:hypothetical protein